MLMMVNYMRRFECQYNGGSSRLGSAIKSHSVKHIHEDRTTALTRGRLPGACIAGGAVNREIEREMETGGLWRKSDASGA